MEFKDFDTLVKAQAYKVITGQLINRDSLNGWLGAAKIYKRMKAIAADDTHPFCDVMEAFLDSVDYNFIEGTVAGDQHIELLDSLIANEPTIGQQLAEIKPLVMARANVVTKPYENKTQADWDRSQGLMAYTSGKPQQKGFIKLTVSADCEPHRPQIFAIVQGIKTRVGTAPEISKGGDYLARVPTSHSSYVVENSYGVIS